jgi:hypothetical protein
MIYGSKRILESASLIVLALLCGCAMPKFAGSRPFDFQRDTFAYANGLVWEYHYDENGKWVHKKREPSPDYYQHCFVMARSARQFFQNARFDPTLPVTNDVAYRTLIYRVVSIDPACPVPEAKRVVIPGYADLRSFSAAKESLLKSECGGAWQSYFQRGHWRIMFPFARSGQKSNAEELLSDLKENRPPVIHIIRFPQLSINHAVVVFAAQETNSAVEFSIYDPNEPAAPRTLTFDRVTQSFRFPDNNYWPGGHVDVYEVYRNVIY